MSRMVEITCVLCGVTVAKRAHQVKMGARYCSTLCSNRGQNKAAFKLPPRVKHPEKFEAKCAYCGKDYIRKRSLDPTVTCSRTCGGLLGAKLHPESRHRGGRPHLWVTVPCVVCGATFRKKPHSLKKHCSEECCSETRRLNALSRVDNPIIQSGPKNPNWKGDEGTRSAMHYRARKILGDAPCAHCGGPGEVVHHRDENPWNNEPTNLQRLCRPCHINHHRHELLAARGINPEGTQTA